LGGRNSGFGGSTSNNDAISRAKGNDDGRLYGDGRGTGASQDVRRGKVYSNVNGYTIVNDTKKSDSESFVNLTEKNTQFSFKEDSDNNKNITTNNENEASDNKKSASYTKAEAVRFYCYKQQNPKGQLSDFVLFG